MSALSLSGCRSVGLPGAGLDEEALEEGVAALSRPLPGPMAALYDLRVPSSGGLRLGVVQTSEGVGRMTVSEPFGSAVAVAGWDGTGRAEVYDLREACRIDGPEAARAFGLGELPFDRAVRLLAGRLPAVDADRIRSVAGVGVEVRGASWRAEVEVEDLPWRVSRVAGGGFEVELDRHTASLPGRIRVTGDEGFAAELTLVRLQWEVAGEVPALPEFPPCHPPEAP